ncbi:MAG TPA: HAMP domain-containing sensor histidine kinase [Candidatus Eisenbacteria bacterium]|jgi:signal transduction histidine kinase
MNPPRGRNSLFWTIAGLFLLTVVLGTVLQWLVAVAVLRPLEIRDARARAEEVASAVAAEVGDSGSLDPTEIGAVLRRHRHELGVRFAWIVYRGRDGIVVSDPPGRVAAGGPRPWRSGRTALIARRSVVRGSVVLGEVAVLHLYPPTGGPGPFGRRTSLLFLPIALIASAIAGLVVVRLLVRRLRGLEVLAARVAEGDLSVRIRDASGDEIGRLAERLDSMTDRLAEARTRVEETDRQRRQLFADITHELATPLTSIRGYAETLLDPGVPVSAEERVRYVRGVLEEARRLDRLTSDLFDLARLEAGATSLNLEALDWAALCRNTVERLEPRFRDAGLRLAWREDSKEVWIQADGHRLVQVLENLLVNTLRYVPAGGTVHLSLGPVPDGERRFRLTVSDDGPGLPPDQVTHVFERFFRGGAPRRADGGDAAEGSGLGLAIVREIVERHGGRVRAEARTPHGLSIHVELPAGAAIPGGAAEQSGRPGAAKEKP